MRLRRRTQQQRRDAKDARDMRALFDEVLEPDSDCVDVGANLGEVLEEILARAPHGRHLAFEPLPELAERLRARFPRVDVHAAALSSAAGRRAFAHVVDLPGWSGFRARPVPGDGPVDAIEVDVERLDDALPAEMAPVLVKIDVEGAELEVLEGARRTLETHRPVVVFEHGAGSADHYGTTPQRMHALFTAELGYAICGLDGDGPYDAERFTELFATGERVNFAARPVS